MYDIFVALARVDEGEPICIRAKNLGFRPANFWGSVASNFCIKYLGLGSTPQLPS